jgi:hypothetical protein
MMWDAWLRTVLGLTPEAPSVPSVLPTLNGSCGVPLAEWSGYAVGLFCSSSRALRYHRDLHGVV